MPPLRPRPHPHPPHPPQKKAKKPSVSQMIDLVVTIKTHTESSKSELSSRGKRPFKVSKYFTDDKILISAASSGGAAASSGGAAASSGGGFVGRGGGFVGRCGSFVGRTVRPNGWLHGQRRAGVFTGFTYYRFVDTPLMALLSVWLIGCVSYGQDLGQDLGQDRGQDLGQDLGLHLLICSS